MTRTSLVLSLVLCLWWRGARTEDRRRADQARTGQGDRCLHREAGPIIEHCQGTAPEPGVVHEGCRRQVQAWPRSA